MSKVINKSTCPSCKSQGGDWDDNNLVTYEDGSTYCFACTYSSKASGFNYNSTNIDLLGEYKDIEDRGLDKETCQKSLYQVCRVHDKDLQVANFKDKNGTIVGQKVRWPDKKFTWQIRPDSLFMYGLYDNYDYDQPLIITEGELDRLSCIQVGYQAISLLDGAGSATRDITRDKEELLKYKEIILFFDNDEAGQKALKDVIPLFPIEKLKYISNYQGLKDANDLLLAGKLSQTMSSFVAEYIPEGIVFGNKLDKKKLLEKKPTGYLAPWPELNRMIRGFRKGKFILLGGGSNIGKSPVLREIGFYLRKTYPNIKVANIFLEEDQFESPQAYIAMAHGVPVQDFIQAPLQYMTQDQYDDYYNQTLNTENLLFLNEEVDFTSKELYTALEYIGSVKKFDVVLLDHLSWVIASGASKEGERRDIDVMMQKIKSICKKTGMVCIAACHLSNPDQGLDWDQGREVRKKDFKGASSLHQVPDIMLSVERNARSDTQKEKSLIRVIKNRGYGSDIGVADTLYYMTATGRLSTFETLFGDKKNE